MAGRLTLFGCSNFHIGNINDIHDLAAAVADSLGNHVQLPANGHKPRFKLSLRFCAEAKHHDEGDSQHRGQK